MPINYQTAVAKPWHESKYCIDFGKDKLPESEHFFVEWCHWRRDQPYTVTAKDGVPSNLRAWMPTYYSLLDRALVHLADAEAYYDEQSMLAAHYERMKASCIKAPMTLLDVTTLAMQKILGEI